MDIRISGKNIKVTEGMKEHLREKLIRLDRYAPRIVEAHAVLKKERYELWAEVTLLAKNLRAYGEGKHKENIFTAMDEAYGRVEKQLKKYREKVKDHHKKDVLGRRKADSNQTGVEDESPRIIKSRDFIAKPMSSEEASMQLAASPRPFLVFQNALTQKVNVIYKREDGNHGIVEADY